MERELVRDFKLKSLPFLTRPIPTKALEWLFLMQHHGAPTRILDWSESPLVALYFCLKCFDREEQGAVWALNPWILNISTVGQQITPTIDSPMVRDYAIDVDALNVPRAPAGEFPIAVKIEYGFNRAHSQRGAATIHGYRKRPIEALRSKVATSRLSKTRQQKFLFKILVDGKRKFDMLKSLYEYGVGADTLFPDLDGLSSALRFRYDHRYLGTKLDRVSR